jgi:hypothetical protein
VVFVKPHAHAVVQLGINYIFFLLAKEIQLGGGLVSLFMLGETHIYKKVGKKILSLIGRARWERLSCGGV